MEQMWKTFLEFKSPATSYQDFKKALLKYYPNTAGDFIYPLWDMDILVGEHLQNTELYTPPPSPHGLRTDS